jgi:hypothetical protein
MAVTENTYTGNGSTVLYSFTFPYLAATDIKVSINGTLTTAYTLANATTVQFNTAPANGAAIRIYRSTDDTAIKATFFPGSSIRAADLNDDFTQALYIAQETANFAASTDASAIQATANAALANSNTAITTANTAATTANSASAAAAAAQTSANNAQASANTALSTMLPLAGGTITGNLVVNGTVSMTGTSFIDIPVGTTAERPAAPNSGQIRFNTDIAQYEGYNGTAWSSIGGGATGGGADRVFQENDQTVTTNYTMTTNRNAVSAGPVTINNGVTVTVPSGSSWVIV